MPRANTAATELSVGFGLLGLDPQSAGPQQLDESFDRTLSLKQYIRYKAEYQRDEGKYQQFYNLGCDLKRNYGPFARAPLTTVRWEGPNRQASTTSVAQDLFAGSTSISVKDDSDVVRNPSPQNLFITLPLAQGSEAHSENWYRQVLPAQYQELYSLARSIWAPALPTTEKEYDLGKSSNLSWSRKALGKLIKDKPNRDFQEHYVNFCHNVAVESADIFNSNLEKTLSSGKRTAVIESILRFFFRLDAQEYLFCGVEGTTCFGVLIPSLNAWKKEWKFISLNAAGDREREQCVVNFTIDLENIKTRQRISRTFHAQVRWSHGKFCGNPEAKLYKGQKKSAWRWAGVDFYTPVIKGTVVKSGVKGVKPNKIALVDQGGFAQVWRASSGRSGGEIALKELSQPIQSEEDVARFRREIEFQSRLVHNHIVPVLDYSLDGDPWYTMPLADTNLDQVIAQFLGKVDRCIQVLLQILDGLKYAHDKGVVHRDLKPANILLFQGDIARIADFGAGKQLGVEGTTTALTQSGSFLGTLEYAAPEQLADMRSADERTDIYALGKILCGMILGKSVVSVQDYSSLPKPYREIVCKCVENDPSQRFQSVEELSNALRMAQ